MFDNYIKMILNSNDFSYLMCFCFYDYFIANFFNELDKQFDGSVEIDSKLGISMLSYNGSSKMKLFFLNNSKFNKIEIISGNQKISFKEEHSGIIDINGEIGKCGNKTSFKGFYSDKLYLEINGKSINTFEELNKDFTICSKNDKCLKI